MRQRDLTLGRRRPPRGAGRSTAGLLRLLAGVALLSVLAAVLVVVIIAALVLNGTDEAGRTATLPGWLMEFKERDEVAYPAHTVAALALERLRMPPEVEALQWLKAAAHARSEEEAERTGRGLLAARQRSRGEASFDAILCQFVVGGGNRGQRIALDRSGMACPFHD